MKAIKMLAVGVILSSFVLGGCSNEKESEVIDNGKVEMNREVTVKDSNNREVTFKEVPKNVIALTSGDLSIITALGESVIGRPTIKGPISDTLKSVKEVGNVMQPNLETIATLKPDLIIGHADFNQKQLKSLEATGSNVYLSRANSVVDIEKNIKTYATILHKETEGNALIKEINKYKEVKATNIKALIVYGTPGEYFVALPESLPGDILNTVGGENVAKDFPKLKEMPQYAKLSMERLLAANPDVIYLLAHGDVDVVKATFLDELKKSKAWQGMNAVKNNEVKVLPNDIFGANPGAKIVDALQYLSKDIQTVGK